MALSYLGFGIPFHNNRSFSCFPCPPTPILTSQVESVLGPAIFVSLSARVARLLEQAVSAITQFSPPLTFRYGFFSTNFPSATLPS